MTPKFDSLDAWLDWHSTLHPQPMALGLDRVAEVWARLGPERLTFPLITVGGTNGKGSCVAMIEAMVSAAGYRCGCYSSPHLLRYNERIRVSGEPVSDDVLCGAFERVEEARKETPLTYFEIGTLAAMDVFVRAGLDLVVLEVGLGGRLDAVNLWNADVSVVTSIGKDHTAWLGETLEEIAQEKAGIFRAERAAIIGQRDAPVRLRDEATRLGALPLQLGIEFDHEPAEAGWILIGTRGERRSLPLPAMRGAFQLDNASVAIMALERLHERLPLSMSAIRAGLQRARLAGRFQVVPGEVTWILDVAHNAAAAYALAGNLRGFQCAGRLRAVIAVLSDKDPEAIVTPLLPHVDEWYLSQSEDARALSVDALQRSLAGVLPDGPAGRFDSLDRALETAVEASSVGDCLLVLGSFTTVAQAMRRNKASLD